MKNLEQDETIRGNNSLDENSLRSIAISLKRIADVITKPVLNKQAIKDMKGER